MAERALDRAKARGVECPKASMPGKNLGKSGSRLELLVQPDDPSELSRFPRSPTSKKVVRKAGAFDATEPSVRRR